MCEPKKNESKKGITEKILWNAVERDYMFSFDPVRFHFER